MTSARQRSSCNGGSDGREKASHVQGGVRVSGTDAHQRIVSRTVRVSVASLLGVCVAFLLELCELAKPIEMPRLCCNTHQCHNRGMAPHMSQQCDIGNVRAARTSPVALLRMMFLASVTPFVKSRWSTARLRGWNLSSNLACTECEPMVKRPSWRYSTSSASALAST